MHPYEALFPSLIASKCFVLFLKFSMLKKQRYVSLKIKGTLTKISWFWLYCYHLHAYTQHIYMLLTIIYIHTQNAHYIICIYRLYIIHNIICIMFQWTAVLQLNYQSMTKTLGLFLLFVKWYCKNHICRFISRQTFKIDLCMWNGYINNLVHVIVLMSTDKIGFENDTLIYTPKNSEECDLCFNMFTNMCKIICANKTNEKNHCVL